MLKNNLLVLKENTGIDIHVSSCVLLMIKIKNDGQIVVHVCH